MNPAPLPEGELLLSRFFDGELGAEEHAKLQAWLREDPAHLDLFAKRAIDHHRTAEVLRVDTMADLVDLEIVTDTEDADIMSEVVASALAERRKHELEDEANRQLAAQQQEDERNRRFEMRRQAAQTQTKRVVVIPKALVYLGLAAAIGLIAWIGWPEASEKMNETDPIVLEPGVDEQVEASVAVVSGTHLARWQGSIDPNGYLREGERVTLLDGFAEVVFGNGATTIFEGPAVFVPTGPGSVNLEHGRVVAHAADSSKPFSVNAPGADSGELTASGNVFGVEVAGDRSAHVAVFDGRVLVASDTGNRRTIRQGEQLDIRVGGTGFVVAEMDAATKSAFAKSLADAQSTVFHYRRAVLASRPIAYWGFDNDLRHGVPNLVRPGTHDLRVFGNPRLVEKGIVGQAAQLDNTQPPYSYFENNGVFEEFDTSGEFTLELWFKADRQVAGSLINLHTGGWSDNVPTFGLIQLQGRVESDYPGWRPLSIRGLHRDPPGRDPLTGINMFSSPQYDAGVWQHVVLVKSRDMLRLYLDSELVAEVPDTDPVSSDAVAIIGILARVHVFRDDSTLPFTGEIDEVALYRHALSQEEVAAHRHAANPR